MPKKDPLWISSGKSTTQLNPAVTESTSDSLTEHISEWKSYLHIYTIIQKIVSHKIFQCFWNVSKAAKAAILRNIITI